MKKEFYSSAMINTSLSIIYFLYKKGYISISSIVYDGEFYKENLFLLISNLISKARNNEVEDDVYVGIAFEISQEYIQKREQQLKLIPYG